MKKYVLFSDGLSPHTYKWAAALANRFDLYIISLSQISEDLSHLVGRDKQYSMNLDINPNGKNHHSIAVIFRLYVVLKKISPNYVNAHYLSSYGFLAALIKGVFGLKAKLITSAWGSDVLVTPYRNKLYFEALRYTLNQADLITSDSEHMSKKIKDISGKEALSFPFGVESLPDVSTHDKYNNVYFSNRALMPLYNIDKVIDLFERIYHNDPTAILYIANNGDQRDTLEEKVKYMDLSGNVIFLGYLNKTEQEALYRRSAFYISIPSSDSTSVSLLEAMAHGCIPIVSDIPVNHEWIRHNINGIIFNDQLRVVDIVDLGKRLDEVFKRNRCIIEEKGIWKNNIEAFINATHTI